MVRFTIIRPSGERYKIHDNGDIERTDIPDFHVSGQWKFLGLQHVKRREFIPFAELTPERVAGLTMLYKNGHPQWTGRDLDHGTMREWGNHGVKAIEYDPDEREKLAQLRAAALAAPVQQQQ